MSREPVLVHNVKILTFIYGANLPEFTKAPRIAACLVNGSGESDIFKISTMQQ